jgi:hypothetical protein
MRFLRTLQADLRERQILPAVALLAVLAIAIPIAASPIVGKVSPPAPVVVAPLHVNLPKGTKSPAEELAALNEVPNTSKTLKGSEPNPFREAAPAASATGTATLPKTTKPAPKTTTTTTPVTPTTTTTTPASTKPKPTTPSGPTGPVGSTGAKGVTLPTGPRSLKPDQAYTANIDTKDAQGVHVLSDVVRLAPLPDAQSPEVIYLGVLAGGAKAAFLFTQAIAVSAKASDALTCLPSTSDCQIVELSPGQGLSLYPTSNTAVIATFSFELVSIGATTFSSDAAAAGARSAVSSAGQTLLPLSNSTALATLSYDAKVGALVHHSAPSGSTGGAGSTGSAGTTGTTGSTGATGGSTGATGFNGAPPRKSRKRSLGVAFAVRNPR